MPRKGNLGTLEVYLALRAKKFQAGLGRASSMLKGFERQASKVGGTLMKVGALMALPLVGGIKAFADLESGMAKVSTMLDEQGMELIPAWTRAVQDIAMASGQTFSALTDALYNIKSATIADADALMVLEASTKAATAGMTDVATATDLATTMLKSFGLEADRVGDIQDWAFAVVKRGKLNYEGLANSLGKVAAAARVSGLPIEELGALIATLTRGGLRAEMATTAAARALQTFTQATPDAKAMAEKFEFALHTNTLETIGLTGVVKKLEKATAAELAIIFKGARAFRAMAIAVTNSADMQKDLAFITDRAGATMEAYMKRQNSLVFQFGRIKQMIIVVGQTIGVALVRQVASAMEKTKQWLGTMRDWLATNPQMIASYASLAVKIFLVGAALKLVSIAAKGAAIAFGILKAVVGVFQIAIAHPAIAVVVALAAGFFLLAREVKKANDRIEQISSISFDERMGVDALKNRLFLLNKVRDETKKLLTDREASTEYHLKNKSGMEEILQQEVIWEKRLAGTKTEIEKVTAAIQTLEAKAATEKKEATKTQLVIDEAQAEAKKEMILAIEDAEERMKKEMGVVKQMEDAVKDLEIQVASFGKTSSEALRIRMEIGREFVDDQELVSYNEQLEKAVALSLKLEALQTQEKRAQAKEDRFDSLQARAERVFAETRTPMERYTARLADLGELLAAGALDWETYERAVKAAGSAMGGAHAPRTGRFEAIRTSLVDVQSLYNSQQTDPIERGLDENKKELEKIRKATETMAEESRLA